MKKIILIIIPLLFLGCAHLQANLDSGSKVSKERRLMVFPFRNPYYSGRELVGIGDAFASTLITEIQAMGRVCELAKSKDFNAHEQVSIDNACIHARQNGSNIAIIGIITEWIDGATNWSGTVDVAAVKVYAYDSENCKLISTVSGRQNGTWFTLVNAPTTRFLKPLSQMVVKSLFE